MFNNTLINTTYQRKNPNVNYEELDKYDNTTLDKLWTKYDPGINFYKQGTYFDENS